MSAKLISLKNLNFAKYLNYVRNSTVISKTELKFSDRYSKKFNCNVWLKREDSQSVRSFKIRGAFCKIMEEMQKRSDVSPPPMIVTASAGNHAQGVALTCKRYFSITFFCILFYIQCTEHLLLRKMQ